MAAGTNAEILNQHLDGRMPSPGQRIGNPDVGGRGAPTRRVAGGAGGGVGEEESEGMKHAPEVFVLDEGV